MNFELLTFPFIIIIIFTFYFFTKLSQYNDSCDFSNREKHPQHPHDIIFLLSVGFISTLHIIKAAHCLNLSFIHRASSDRENISQEFDVNLFSFWGNEEAAGQSGFRRGAFCA